MTSTPTTNCGNRDHTDECLCDVVITNPAPINYTFGEVWHADIVARATGYTEDSEGAALADFLEALSSAYDATRNLANLDEHYADGVLTSGLREVVAAHLKEGESIIDLPDLIGESHARILAAITQAQPSIVWTWSEAEWATFEDHLRASTSLSSSQLERQFGISRHQAQSLVGLYGRSTEAEWKAERLGASSEMFTEHPDATASEIVAMLAERGIEASVHTIRKQRQRWRKRMNR